MKLKTFNVPFTNGSLNGIIRRISNLTSIENIEEEGLIHLSASSTLSGTRLSNIIGAPVTSTHIYWRTLSDDTNRWLTIDFGSFRVDIEGYTIHTGGGDYHPYWEIQSSIDGNSWTLIHSYNLSSSPSSWITSYLIDHSQRLRYLQMIPYGTQFSGADQRFALYGFDVFGKLLVPSYLQCSYSYSVSYSKVLIL